MDKALVKKLYEMAGAVKMAEATSRLMDAARYTFIKQIRESKAYKQLNMDWHEFCKEVLGKDHKTVDVEIKLLEEYGESFISALSRVGLTKRDLLILDRGLTIEEKGKVKDGIIPLNGRDFKPTEIEDNLDEFLHGLDHLKQKAALAEKMEKAHDKFIKQQEKLEIGLRQEIKELEQELAAREPAATDEARKKQFDEQLDLVYKHLAEAGKLMNTVIDFSLCDNDRECAIKYRATVKAVQNLSDNLFNKIGEND